MDNCDLSKKKLKSAFQKAVFKNHFSHLTDNSKLGMNQTF